MRYLKVALSLTVSFNNIQLPTIITYDELPTIIMPKLFFDSLRLELLIFVTVDFSFLYRILS